MSFYLPPEELILQELGLLLEVGRYDRVISRLDEVADDRQQLLMEKENIRALALQGKGEYKKSLISSSRACRLAEELGNTQWIAKSEVIHCTALWRLGDLKTATQRLNNVDAMIGGTQQPNTLYYEARLLMILGDILWIRGFYSDAISYVKKALEIWIELGDENQNHALNNLGYINLMYGETETALDFLLQAYPFIEKQGNMVILARLYMNLILTHSLLDERDMVEYQLEKLGSINDSVENKLIQTYYTFSQAVAHLMRNRVVYLVQAMELFKKISESDIDFHYRRLSFLYIIKILLLEYKLTTNEDLIKNIWTEIDLLDNLAMNFESVPYKSEVHLLKAKLYSFSKNIDMAEAEIDLAIRKANHEGFIILGKLLLAERKNIISRVSPVGIDDIVTTLEDLLHFKYITERNVENAILFQIISKAGNAVYTYAIDENIDDNLLNNIQNAINIFCSDVFETETVVNHIWFEDYTILLRAIDDCLFCLVTSGRQKEENHSFIQIVNDILRAVDLHNIHEYEAEVTRIIDHDLV